MKTNKSFDKQTTDSLQGVRILLAEDNHINRLVVKKLLTNLGILLTETENGYDALEQSKQNKYDLILMDIEMPVMDGYEAVSELRKIGDKTPILAFTSLQHSQILCKVKRTGFDDMVVKPFNPADLILRIEHYIAVAGGLNCN
jgi:two-component system, sensor histidine kinase